MLLVLNRGKALPTTVPKLRSMIQSVHNCCQCTRCKQATFPAAAAQTAVVVLLQAYCLVCWWDMGYCREDSPRWGRPGRLQRL